MATEIEARKDLYLAFLSAISPALPSERIQFDNQGFKEPEGVSWVRMVVRHSEGRQQTVGSPGNRIFERRGNALVSIFTPAYLSTEESDRLSRIARGAFEGVRFPNTGIRINGVSQRETGIVEDIWYQVVIDAEFVYTEKK